MPQNFPREVWAQIATAAKRHANFDPQQLALVSTAARDGVRDTTGAPNRLAEIVNFGRAHIRTEHGLIHEGRRMGLQRAAGVFRLQGRDLYEAALSALTGRTGTFEPTDLQAMDIQGDSPLPDEFFVWCEENLADVCDPGDAEELYFNTWDRIFQYYDPVAKAWLRMVCADRNMDLGEAWDKARKDYVASKGVPVDR